MPNMFAVIIGAAIVTFCIRYLPVVLLHNRRFPLLLERFLYNLPIGMLTVIVVQSAFLKEGKLYSGWSDYSLIGFVACVILAITTKNLALIVFGGMGVLAFVSYITGLI